MKRKHLKCHDCKEPLLVSWGDPRDPKAPPELCNDCWHGRQIDHDREEWKERNIRERMGEE